MEKDTQPWVCTIPVAEPWKTGQAVAEILISAGFETYAAGGCVRDLLLGNAVQDIDLATAAHPEEVELQFAQHGWQTVAVGKAFGVIIVVAPNGSQVEVATFRNDGAYIDGRRPSQVHFSTAQEDVERRDFTINALLINIKTGIIYDYVHGKADLEKKIIRAVGDAAARLHEDRLRVLRALRFAARLNFVIEASTWDAVCVTSLAGVSKERVLQEWNKAMAAYGRDQWFKLLINSGHLAQVCQPLAELPGTTLQMIGDYLTRLRDDDDETIIFAVCLGPCPLNQVQAWLEAMPLAVALKRSVIWIYKQAENPNSLREQRLAYRRRCWRHPDGQRLARVLSIRYGSSVDNLLAEQAAEHHATITPLLHAEDLMALGVQPGPQFGALLHAIQDQQLEGLLTNHQAAVGFARQWLSEQAKNDGLGS